MSKKSKSMLMSVTLLVVFLLSGLSLDVSASEERQWQFRVFLDDREIGYHKVRLIPEENGQRVNVEANFKVKFLFLTAYRYEHQTEEFWRGACLADIQSHTDDNGKELFIKAQPESDAFRLLTHDGVQELEGCIRSFAYWNPELLNADRLLNTQTGQYQKVEVVQMGDTSIEIEGKPVNARQYRLNIEDYSIDLWYTPDMNWLALQSMTEGGYRLRYLPETRVF